MTSDLDLRQQLHEMLQIELAINETELRVTRVAAECSSPVT